MQQEKFYYMTNKIICIYVLLQFCMKDQTCLDTDTIEEKCCEKYCLSKNIQFHMGKIMSICTLSSDFQTKDKTCLGYQDKVKIIMCKNIFRLWMQNNPCKKLLQKKSCMQIRHVARNFDRGYKQQPHLNRWIFNAPCFQSTSNKKCIFLLLFS